MRRRIRPPNVPDLDHMTPEQLAQFIALWDGTFPPERSTRNRQAEFSRKIFPDRPLGFTLAAIGLHRIARAIRDGRPTFRIYRTLPAWARFRDTYDIAAAKLK